MVDVDPDIKDPVEFAKFTALTGDPMVTEPDSGKKHVEATHAEDESVEPEMTETEEDTLPKVDVELLAKSTQALKRYGVTAKMLNKMDPDEIIESGANLLKIQEDNDKAQSELKTLRLTKEKPAGDDKTPATQAADLSKLAKRWAEKHAVEETEMAPLLAEFATEATKGLQARLDALEAREVQRTIDSAVQKVGTEFPIVLEDAQAKDKLLKKAQQISGGYDNEHECLVDAAKLLGFKTAAASKAEAASKAKETSRAADSQTKKQGLMSVNGRAPSTSALSKEDLEFKAFLQLEQGNQPEFQRLIALSKRAV